MKNECPEVITDNAKAIDKIISILKYRINLAKANNKDSVMIFFTYAQCELLIEVMNGKSTIGDFKSEKVKI